MYDTRPVQTIALQCMDIPQSAEVTKIDQEKNDETNTHTRRRRKKPRMANTLLQLLLMIMMITYYVYLQSAMQLLIKIR